MRKNLKTNGIVLARRNIGEADRLLTVFTDELGKVKIIARGSRKIKSKLASHIEPFSTGSFEFIDGKTFYILVGAQKLPPVIELAKDLELYQTLSYICELVDVAFHENEPNPSVYRLLQEVTDAISNNPAINKKLLRQYFEMKLLVGLGYKPDYHHCKKCQGILAESDSYAASFEGAVCKTCGETGGRISKNTLKLLRLMEQGQLNELLAINNVDELSAELDQIIQPYLLDILPRKPRSLEL